MPKEKIYFLDFGSVNHGGIKIMARKSLRK